MRTVLYAVAAIAALAVLPPILVRIALASTAATLIEATPFLLLGIVLARVPRLGSLIAYLGCGCTRGPSARSVPAAIATWLLLGPFVACARIVAATVVAKATASRLSGESHDSHPVNLIAELESLLPCAVVAAAVLTLWPLLPQARMNTAAHLALGIVLGLFSPPCALGAVAIAGSLHATSPIASVGFLCVAGIVDLRSLTGTRRHVRLTSNSLAMLMVALTLLLVAMQHGAALINPRATIPIAIAGVATVALAFRGHTRRSLALAIAPCIMLLGTVISAPTPTYHATETTLSDLFVGERLTFVGILDHERNADALVRFAITCCRADASPLVIRLARPVAIDSGRWLSASGSIVRVGDELCLHADSVHRIAPPTDPFIYR